MEQTMSNCPPKSSKLPKPFYERDGITIYHGNCINIIPLLPKFDLCLTDPPYGLGDKWNGGTWGACKNCKHPELKEWDEKPITKDEVDLLRSRSTFQIIWGGNYFELPPSRCWMVWEKPQRIQTCADFEMAWTNFDRPAKSFLEGRQKGVFHPTQKPLDLILWCVQFQEGIKTVVDPFMGSGTTLIACKQKGIRAVGIEMRLDYCKVAVDRLRQDYLTL